MYFFPRVADVEAVWPVTSGSGASVGHDQVVVCLPTPHSEEVYFYARIVVWLLCCCWLAGVHGQCSQLLVQLFLILIIQFGLEVESFGCGSG